MRRLTTLLTLLSSVLLARAQSWDVVDFRQFDDETIVYACLDYNTNEPVENWMVGAFIDGLCHGESDMPTTGPDGSKFFVLRVHGNREADMGKPIIFRVRHQVSDRIFFCQSNIPVTFTGESEGEPSSPIVLTFTVSEPVPLQGFLVSVEKSVAGQESQMTLTWCGLWRAW
jgi:hypothetical protein